MEDLLFIGIAAGFVAGFLLAWFLALYCKKKEII